MRKIIISLLALVIISSLVLTGCGTSKSTVDNSWEKIKEKGEFVLGLDASFPPMGFRDADDKIVGFDIDLAKEACSRLGVELKLQPISWDAKDQELNTGNIDCIWNGFTMTKERKESILFTKPYMTNRQVFVVKADSKIDKLSDLEGKKLALQADSSAESALDKAEDFKSKLGDVIPLDEYLTALMDLEKGGVSAVLMDEVVAVYYIKTNNKDFKILDETLANEEYGVGFRKNDVSLMEKFQEALDAMQKDGKFDEISKKWFGEEKSTVSE